MTLQSSAASDATASLITITISATLDNYPAITPVTQTFDIEIVDHCTTTMLSFYPAVVDMLAYVYLAADTQTVVATDT